MFLFPLKKPRLRSQWCVTGCTPSREFHWSHVRCASCLQGIPQDQTHGLYSRRASRQISAPQGTAGHSANAAAGEKKSKVGWTPLQSFLTDPAGLEIGWKSSEKRQLGEILLLPLWSKWETVLKLIICALSPYLGQEPKTQRAWT